MRDLFDYYGPGEKQKAELPGEFQELEEQLRVSIKTKCSSEHIINLVEKFLKSYIRKKRIFTPRNKDLKQPTLSEEKFEGKRIIKRNNKGK